MQLTLLILICCLFPFVMTVLGAAAVFLCPGGMRRTSRRVFLGFAAGVMLAASIWSLLTPAIDASEDLGLAGWIPASVGILVGVLFLLLADLAVMRLRSGGKRAGSGFLLQLAMTLHNIPEGMAVGLSAALAADAIGAAFIVDGIPSIGTLLVGAQDSAVGAELSAALALSLGIGIQNFPEGAAVSLPLRQEGFSTGRAFLRGCLSGAVEPFFALAAVLFLSEAHAVMPWLLSFAAGAMLYVVVCELIPAANETVEDGCVSVIGPLSVVGGFLVMMILDVALG